MSIGLWKREKEKKEASYSNVSRSLADSDTSLTGFTELRSENAAIAVPQPPQGARIAGHRKRL